jgi:hypothetical protein
MRRQELGSRQLKVVKYLYKHDRVHARDERALGESTNGKCNTATPRPYIRNEVAS